MNDRIHQILAQIAVPEDDLRTAVHDRESRMFFQIRGKRVEFERSVREAHVKLKLNFFRWLVTNRPQNLIAGPLIYGMVVSLLLLDICVSFCQWACFPIYGIAKVRRADYLVFDRRHLAYLNSIEKLHCTYCEYGNGLMGYMAEISDPDRTVFLPDQARPQDPRHALPLQALPGLWRGRCLRSQAGGIPAGTGKPRMSPVTPRAW